MHQDQASGSSIRIKHQDQVSESSIRIKHQDQASRSSQAYLLSPCSNQARRENSPSWLARSSFFTIFIFFFHHIIQLFVLDKSCFTIFFISCQISKIMFWGKMG